MGFGVLTGHPVVEDLGDSAHAGHDLRGHGVHDEHAPLCVLHTAQHLVLCSGASKPVVTPPRMVASVS